MKRALQTSAVYFSRVSYLFECNANDTYVLRMTNMNTRSFVLYVGGRPDHFAPYLVVEHVIVNMAAGCNSESFHNWLC